MAEVTVMSTKRLKRSARDRRQALVGAAYIAPSAILMLIFNIIPLVMTVYLSFTKYNMVGSPAWIGLKNYQKLLTNKVLAEALRNTVFYVLMTVPAQTILALLVANFLAESVKNRYGSLLRSMIFIPVIVSLIASATVWRILYNTNGGLINQVLGAFGVPPVNFLGSSSSALLCVAVVAVWKNTGYYMVMFYAGVLNVSRDVKEAAVVDGANAWQRFTHVTLPILKPITYMVLTLGIIGSFQVFDLVYKMTGGGPGYSTYTVAYVIYTYAFQDKRIGYGCALAVGLVIVILLIHAVQTWVFREKE